MEPERRGASKGKVGEGWETREGTEEVGVTESGAAKGGRTCRGGWEVQEREYREGEHDLLKTSSNSKRCRLPTFQ